MRLEPLCRITLGDRERWRTGSERLVFAVAALVWEPLPESAGYDLSR